MVVGENPCFSDIALRRKAYVRTFRSFVTIENALREFAVPFTIIRPNYFMQNDASLKDPLTKAGVYPMPL